MPTFADLKAVLDAEIMLLDDRFMKHWIPALPEHSPDDFQHDVKAYCVLAHAAFEEFAEDASLLALQNARDAWISKKFSPATVALLGTYDFVLDISDDENGEQERIFDQVRKALDAHIDRHSKSISNNHGFSLKYLRSMLLPVGIDIPDSVRHMASLKDLAEARGSYAHTRANRALYGQWKRAGRPMEPEKAKSAVHDCLELCRLVIEKLEAIA
jgi:hypothetical protein